MRPLRPVYTPRIAEGCDAREDTMATQTVGTDRYVKVNGLRLHYLEWGAAGAPPIVMLHGLRGSAHTWDLVAEPISDRYHVFALDQRGRGDSDWAPGGQYTRAD